MATKFRFGVFHPPFHLPVDRNPTLWLQRDVELVQLLDRLGYEEAWIGEHHSCGAELISDNLMFLAYVAPLTRRIALCAGVVSLPYHNPLWVADRAIQLDHLTRGRFTLGLGPGSLTTDAFMIGLDPSTQREALEEDADVLMRLLYSDEPVSVETARYRLVDARVQVRPTEDLKVAVAATASPTGPRIAGKYGAGLVSIGATMAANAPSGRDTLGLMWKAYEDQCAAFGHTAERNGWRMVGPMHIAETREQARADVRHGLDTWFDYMQHTQAATHFKVVGETTDERIEWINESGTGVIGTPEDAVLQIERLVDESKGGFGGYLMMTHEWARWEATKESYALVADRVVPVFQDGIRRRVEAEEWGRGKRNVLGAAQMANVMQSIERHASESGDSVTSWKPA